LSEAQRREGFKDDKSRKKAQNSQKLKATYNKIKWLQTRKIQSVTFYETIKDSIKMIYPQCRENMGAT
jgi:hypothetical protein